MPDPKFHHTADELRQVIAVLDALNAPADSDCKFADGRIVRAQECQYTTAPAVGSTEDREEG